MERQIKGIWIPIEIWENTELSWNEKILLMEIDSFTSKSMECFFSNEYIGKLLNVDERTARRYLSKLITLGYVKVVRFDGRVRFVRSTLATNVHPDWTELSTQTDQECPHNNRDEQTSKEDVCIRGRKFIAPTLEQVQAYCQERMNNINPEAFINYYESNGWMVGKNKMKDWKAAVRTWENNSRQTKTPRPTYQKETAFQKTLKVLDEVSGSNYYEQAYGIKH